MARRTTRKPPAEDVVETILDVDVADEMRGSFLEYAYSVIYSRAIPDARDGLKPVQRRILFQMNEMGLRPNRPHVKCGRVVGDVMGKLHPHGDGAIYDTLVRLAQPWTMRVPLVDGHGNFGSPDDGPAAYRYCLTGDARVRLADGRSPRIADLVGLPAGSEAVADVDVLDKDGKPARVTRVFNSGVHATKRLVTADGYELRGSHNHPVLCLVPVLGVPVFQWLRLDEITTGTLVCLARNAWSAAIPTAREWMLGVLAGAWTTEGWASPTRAGFNNTDKQFFDHVLHAYDALVGGPRYVYSRMTRRDHKLIYELDTQNLDRLKVSPLAEFIDRRALAKHVPGYVWEGGPGVKRAFLMAAFEGDGSVTKANGDTFTVQFHSYSRELARGIQDLLLEFGVHSHLSRYSRGENRIVVSGRHNIRAFAERVGFLTAKQRRLRDLLDSVPTRTHRLTRDYAPFVADYVRSALPAGRGHSRHWFASNNFDRFERWWADRSLIISKFKDEEILRTILPIMDSGYRFVRVAQIVDDEPAEVFSLRVESEDHSFLANGFVNHNTECRMAEPTTLLTGSLDEDVVDMVPNYDGTYQQPEVLPAAFPNLLVNGASGIAVGMATNMPPHNLGEVIEAARHLLVHPDATVDDLMRFVPGPDLPTGGRIVGLDGVREAYESGRGSFRTRAAARIENITARRQGIVITELPYAVGPERVRERIADLVRSKKLLGVNDVEDYTDRNTGLRLVVELKSGFVPEAVLEQLYRLTPLEDSFSINNVALVDGQPRTMGLRELLEVFLAHRLEVVRRRSEHRRNRHRDRLHLVEGLLVALLDIDEVIQVIRTSDDATVARGRLMTVFDLSEAQARYILDTPLRRLTRYDRLELDGESETLRRTIAELTEILEDPAAMRRLVADELADVAAAHATPRRTVLLESAGQPAVAASAALEVSDDPCRVLLSSTGLLARTTSADAVPAGGKRSKHDVVVSAVESTARGHVGVVTSAGRLVRMAVLDLPALPPTAQAPTLAGGAPLTEFLELEHGERVLCLTTMDPGTPGLALGTERGVVKRVVPDHPTNKDAWEIVRLDDGDLVVGAVELRTGDEDLVFVTSDAQLLRFGAASVRPQGRTGGGIAGIRVGAGARVIHFGAVDADDAVVVTVAGSSSALPGTQSGTVKVTPFHDYPAKGRATGGVRCHRFLRGEDTLLLAWAGAAPPMAAAGSGVPIALPEPVGRRDGSGTPAAQSIAAVSGPAWSAVGDSVTG